MSNEKKSFIKSNILYISKIPTQSNTIEKLFLHFKEYGRIRSIYSEGTHAVIAYETPEGAKIAYDSPEAYENNRFVKYRYHKNPKHAETDLYSVCDIPRIQAAIKEAKWQIEEAQKHTDDIVNKLNQSKPKGEIDDFKQIKDEYQKMYDEIQDKMKDLDPASDEYQTNLNELKEIEEEMKTADMNIQRLEEEEENENETNQ